MYRTICTELWTDPEIKTLPVPIKLLFVYLITNPHTHLSGIYYCPQETILKETGLKLLPYRYGIDTLSQLEKAHADPHTETIFVVNMFAYQGQGPKNEISASKHLETLHDSCLIPRFLARYPQIPYRYPIQDRPSVPDPVSASVANPEGKKIAKKKGNGAHPIPEEWRPNENHQKLAGVRKLDLPIEAAHFRGKAKELDWQTKDWDQKFTNWMLQEIKFRQRRTP